MSKSFGVDQTVFKKKFSSTGEYTTTENVNFEINRYFPSTTGTVQRITTGKGLSVTDSIDSNFITSSGTINLEAGLSELNDVSYTATPTDFDVLLWENGGWKPRPIGTITGGASPGIITISDLQNINTITPADYVNPLIMTNTVGTSNLSFERNLFLKTTEITSGEGIAHQITTNPSQLSKVTFKSNLGSIPLVYSSHTGHSFAITDKNLQQKRIPAGNISLTNFLNDGPNPFLNQITFTGTTTLTGQNGTPFSFISTGSSAQIGVCIGSFSTVDLSNNVTNQLPIANGGTNSATASGARTNLGLVIGTDILSKDSPSFSGSLTGEDIGLSSGVCKYTYINMGSTLTGSEYPGFRFDKTTNFIQFQNLPLSGWADVYPGISPGTSIGIMSDVDTTGTGVSDILIYDGTNFKNQQITGLITLNKNGVTGLCSTAVIPAGNVGTINTVTDAEFGYLAGSTSSIQTQLDNKITYSQSPNQGDILYYSNPVAGLSTVNTLSLGVDYQIVTKKPGNSLPEWSNIYHAFESNNSTFDSVGVFDSTPSSGFRLDKNNFLSDISGQGTSTGIGSATTLQLLIRGVSNETNISTTDFLYFEKSLGTDYRRNITFTDFTKNLVIPTYGTSANAITANAPSYSFAYFTTNNELGFNEGGTWKKISLTDLT